MRLLPPKLCVDFTMDNIVINTLDKMQVHDFQPYTHGQSSLIYLGELNGEKVIVKTSRKDKGDKKEVCLNEGGMLKILNQKGIGPELIYYDQNLVVMKYLEGIGLNSYLSCHSPDEVRYVLNSIFLQLFEIDKSGIDKGESQKPDKHVIISDFDTTIIDFEKARRSNNPRNVSGFVGAIFSDRYQRLLNHVGVANLDPLRAYSFSRQYLNNPNQQTFNNLVEIVVFG
jgi:predicted Ser/Thr protein kinase